MEPLDWSKAAVLITGGTGSFGKKFVEIMLKEKRPHRLIVFSREELKQHEMREVFSDDGASALCNFRATTRQRVRI